jgi:hypothetical protein
MADVVDDLILNQILGKLTDMGSDTAPGSIGGNLASVKKDSSQLLRDIRAHNIKLLRAINKGNKTSETSARTTAKQTKGKNKSSSKDAATAKQSKKSDNALVTISNHLKDIKSFASLFKKIKESGNVCVLGNEEKIKKSKNRFDHLVKVFD